MADRTSLWLKLWCDSLTDLATSQLSNDDWGFITRLWMLLKKERQEPFGSLTLERPATIPCALLHVTDCDELIAKLNDISPHFRNMSLVTIDERHITVTFSKWLKHQGDRSASRTSLWRERKKLERFKSDAYSPSISISHSPSISKGVKEESEKPSEGIRKARKRHEDNGLEPAGFIAFRESYPKKVAKAETLLEWKVGHLETLTPEILAGVERYKKTKRVQDGFVMDPQRWLKKKRWQDEEPPAPTKPSISDIGDFSDPERY